jgi:hydroxymethylpyrimidine pyrophosphatase-like HAD family hydrolase
VNDEGKEYSNSFEIFEHWDAMDIVPIGVSKAKGIQLLSQVRFHACPRLLCFCLFVFNVGTHG